MWKGHRIMAPIEVFALSILASYWEVTVKHFLFPEIGFSVTLGNSKGVRVRGAKPEESSE